MNKTARCPITWSPRECYRLLDEMNDKLPNTTSWAGDTVSSLSRHWIELAERLWKQRIHRDVPNAELLMPTIWTMMEYAVAGPAAAQYCKALSMRALYGERHEASALAIYNTLMHGIESMAFDPRDVEQIRIPAGRELSNAEMMAACTPRVLDGPSRVAIGVDHSQEFISVSLTVINSGADCRRTSQLGRSGLVLKDGECLGGILETAIPARSITSLNVFINPDGSHHSDGASIIVEGHYYPVACSMQSPAEAAALLGTGAASRSDQPSHAIAVANLLTSLAKRPRMGNEAN